MSITILNEVQIINSFNAKIKVVSKTTEKALIEVGERGVGILKENTPVALVNGGRLRNSMSYSIKNKVVNPDSPFEAGDEIRGNNEKLGVAIGTNVNYAPPVEFIPSSSSANLGFMARSYKQLKPVAETIFKEALREVTR